MADPTVLEVYRREVTPELYRDIRELYKTHSIAEDVRRSHGAAGVDRHLLPRLQPSPCRAVGNTEGVRGDHVEAAGARRFGERVPERLRPVLDRESLDRVVAALERLPRLELHDRQWIRKPAEERVQPLEQVAQSARPVDRERRLVAAAQRERLQHPRQAEEVIGMEVREEDLLQVGQPDRRPLQLPLRPLAAVEEEPLAAAPDDQGRRPALRGRHRGGGAEEDDVEVHPAILGTQG